MSNDQTDGDPITDAKADAAQQPPPRLDPNDVLDVPDVMYPAELDARGDAVNALRSAAGLPVPETHDEDRGASYA